MKNEIQKVKNGKMHTDVIKDEEGKAIGHKTTIEKEGKNWKAKATKAKAHKKTNDGEYTMEEFSSSYEYQAPDYDQDNDYLQDEE